MRGKWKIAFFLLGFIFVLTFSMIGLSNYFLKVSEPYKISIEYLNNNETLIKKIGKVKEVDLKRGNKKCKNQICDSEFDYQITGEKAKAKVEIRLHKEFSSDWKVIDFTIE